MRHALRETPAIVAGLLFVLTTSMAAPWTIYETGFEPPEFVAGNALDGQGDWLVPWWAIPEDEWATSRIDAGYFDGLGQQALIGLSAPTAQLDSVSAYRRLFVDPVGRGTPLVVFTVTMAILDDTAPDHDSFRWVVYNRDLIQERLFSLDFDLETTDITYLLEDNSQAVATGYAFLPEHLYQLAIIMNFADNHWSATLNNALIVNTAPLTTSGRTLDLGDIDAAWVLGPSSTGFGDAYMVFDEFRVVADVAAPLPCQLTPLGHLADGSFLIELSGEPGRTYAVDASSDLLVWTAVATNAPGDGSFVLLDKEVAGWPQQFYRGRPVWP